MYSWSVILLQHPYITLDFSPHVYFLWCMYNWKQFTQINYCLVWSIPWLNQSIFIYFIIIIYVFILLFLQIISNGKIRNWCWSLHEELTLFMPVNSPSDYFPRGIVLNILTSCDTFQPIKLHYPHPKNNKQIYLEMKWYFTYCDVYHVLWRCCHTLSHLPCVACYFLTGNTIRVNITDIDLTGRFQVHQIAFVITRWPSKCVILEVWKE